MLFNLSSNGEPDPARFKNTFSNPIVIEPDSHICLISASVVEDLSNAAITIAANTTINLRFDAFNVFQAIINAQETTYTLSQFVDRLNALCSQKICLGRRFVAKLANNAGNLAVAFQMYNVDDADTNWMRYVFPINTVTADQNPDQASNWLMGQFPGTFNDPNLTVSKGDIAEASDNILGLFVNAPPAGGDNYLFLFDSKLLNTLAGFAQEYEQVNQPSHEVVQPLVGVRDDNQHVGEDDNNDDWIWSAFTVANPPTVERGRGVGTADMGFTVKNTHFTGGNMTDYGDTEYLAIIFDGEANAYTQLLNNTTNTMDTVNTVKYQLGDQYRIWYGHTGGTNYVPYVKRYNYEGLVAWIPNQLEWDTGAGATAKTFNTRTILPYPGVNLLYKQAYANTRDQFNAQFDSTTTKRGGSNSMMGCWLSKGFNDRTYTSQTHAGYLDNGLNGTITDVSYPGNYSQFTKDCVQFERVDTITPEPPTANSSKRNVLSLPFEMDSKGATMISCLLRFKNDSAVVTGAGQYAMTAFGGLTYAGAKQFIIRFEINPSVSGAVFDVTINDSAGSPTNLSLLNGATPIDIQYDQWYHFVYVDGGDTAFRVDMTNIDTGDVFTGNGTHTNIGIGRINTIAGAVDDNDAAFQQADNYMFGHVMDFRYYQTPYYAARLLTDYDPTITNLRNGYVNGTLNTSIFGRPQISGAYLAGENKYASVPQPSTDIQDTTVSSFSITSVRPEDIPKSLYFFTDPWLPQDIKIPYNLRTRFMPARALTGRGNGLVEAEGLRLDFDFPNYDAANERVILPYQQTPDGINNPFFNEVADVNDLELQDEIFNVEVTNLPHRSYNGKTRSMDKTIYSLPIESGLEKNNLKITEHSPAAKVWIPLNNPGEIPLNELHIQISKEDGTKADNLQPDSHLSIQIETRENRI